MAAFNPDSPEPIGPGEDDSSQPMGPDQSAVDQVNSAINQGYSYADVVAYHDDNNLPTPPQPSLDAIMSGDISDASQWQHPQYEGDNSSGPAPDLPLGGAGPIGDALMMGAAGAIPGLARAAIGGVAEGVLTDIAGAQANPVRALVQTSADELQGAMTPLDLAVENVRIPGAVRYGLAAEAAREIMGKVGLGAGQGEDQFPNTPTPRRSKEPEHGAQ